MELKVLIIKLTEFWLDVHIGGIPLPIMTHGVTALSQFESKTKTVRKTVEFNKSGTSGEVEWMPLWSIAF